MKVVRKITYEGSEEELVRAMRKALADGTYNNSTVEFTVETIEQPDSVDIHKAIMHPVVVV